MPQDATGLSKEGFQMRGRRPTPFQLTPKAEELLRRIANNGARPYLAVRRARVLLARAAGMRIKHIAERFLLDPSVIFRIVQNFERQGFKSLEPKSMPKELAIPAMSQTFVDPPKPETNDGDLHPAEFFGIDWG